MDEKSDKLTLKESDTFKVFNKLESSKKDDIKNIKLVYEKNKNKKKNNDKVTLFDDADEYSNQ